MKTLVTSIQKGGQGKTFVTCHLAFDFLEKNQKICVIDFDGQANTSYTLGEYAIGIPTVDLLKHKNAVEKNDLKEKIQNNQLVVFHATQEIADLKMGMQDLENCDENFKSNIKTLGESFDVCLIDTAPTLDAELLIALSAADFMMSPIEMETFSLIGANNILAIFKQIKKQNPKLQFIGMLPNKIDVRKPRQMAKIEELKKLYNKILMPFAVSNRDSFAEAMESKKPVWQIKKSAAKKAMKEIKAVAQYVFDTMTTKSA